MKRSREELQQIGPWTVEGVLGWSAQATVLQVEQTTKEGTQRVSSRLTTAGCRAGLCDVTEMSVGCAGSAED